MVGFSALALWPDLDVVGFRLGIPYEAALGHRGASHSLLVAVAAGVVVGSLIPPVLGERVRDPRVARVLTLALAVAVLASHGLLDALTDGGLGPALLWPLDDARWFFDWRPIPVSPIGRGMLSVRGALVVATELLYFAPCLAYASWPRRRRLEPRT